MSSRAMSKRNIVILVFGLAAVAGLLIVYAQTGRVGCTADVNNGPKIDLFAKNSTPLYTNPAWRFDGARYEEYEDVTGTASVTSQNRLRWVGEWQIMEGIIKVTMEGSAGCTPVKL